MYAAGNTFLPQWLAIWRAVAALGPLGWWNSVLLPVLRPLQLRECPGFALGGVGSMTQEDELLSVDLHDALPAMEPEGLWVSPKLTSVKIRGQF